MCLVPIKHQEHCQELALTRMSIEWDDNEWVWQSQDKTDLPYSPFGQELSRGNTTGSNPSHLKNEFKDSQ